MSKKVQMQRDESFSMADQCCNPGALYPGLFARRYGSRTHYEPGNGHKCAIFQTPAHGAAALCELILNRKGLTVHEYINGGDTLPAKKSYSGGADYVANGYTDNMRTYGVAPEEVITQDDNFLIRMINAHAKCEGNEFQITPQYFNVVRRLMKKRSKVYK